MSHEQSQPPAHLDDETARWLHRVLKGERGPALHKIAPQRYRRKQSDRRHRLKKLAIELQEGRKNAVAGVCDGFGRPVPERLRMVFLKRSHAQLLENDSWDLMGAINLAYGESDMDPDEADGLDAIFAAIKAAMVFARKRFVPFCMCPKCNANGLPCPVCRDRGWVNQDQWEVLVGSLGYDQSYTPERGKASYSGGLGGSAAIRVGRSGGAGQGNQGSLPEHREERLPNQGTATASCGRTGQKRLEGPTHEDAA